jgi:hypothetical protein
MTTISKPTGTTVPTDEAEVSDEELKFVIPGDRRIEAANAITTRSMAKRLPQLIRRSLALGWQVDHAAVVALLGVQILSGVLEAFGLMATTGVIKPLIASQHISGDQLRSAVPSLVVLSGAIGLRALLGIASTALSARLAPRIAREAELKLLDAATKAELAAYDNPGYNDRWDAADRGVEVSRDFLTQAQYILAASASLIASACVLTAVHPILLPLLVLAALPKGLASVRAARISRLARHIQGQAAAGHAALVHGRQADRRPGPLGHHGAVPARQVPHGWVADRRDDRPGQLALCQDLPSGWGRGRSRPRGRVGGVGVVVVRRADLGRRARHRVPRAGPRERGTGRGRRLRSPTLSPQRVPRAPTRSSTGCVVG